MNQGLYQDEEKPANARATTEDSDLYHGSAWQHLAVGAALGAVGFMLRSLS